MLLRRPTMQEAKRQRGSAALPTTENAERQRGSPRTPSGQGAARNPDRWFGSDEQDSQDDPGNPIPILMVFPDSRGLASIRGSTNVEL